MVQIGYLNFMGRKLLLGVLPALRRWPQDRLGGIAMATRRKPVIAVTIVGKLGTMLLNVVRLSASTLLDSNVGPGRGRGSRLKYLRLRSIVPSVSPAGD